MAAPEPSQTAATNTTTAATTATTTQPVPTAATTGGAPAPKTKLPKKIQQKPVSKKRKFVKDGIFYAEINEFFKRELSENGYAGCEVRVTPTRTEIIIRATQATLVVGDNGKRIRELTALIQKKFKFPKKGVVLFCEKVRNQGLSALAQSEAVKYRLLQGLSVRRAAYSVLKFIMDRGADGCEITISGKLRGQRAKAMKFRDGYMIHAGDAVNYYIDRAIKHVHLRQGVIGIRVKIMLPHMETDREGKQHIIVQRELPDKVHVKEPKDIEFDDDAKNQEQLQRGIQQDFATQKVLHPSQQGPQDTQHSLGDIPAASSSNQPIPQQQQHTHQQQPLQNVHDNQNYQNVDQSYDYQYDHNAQHNQAYQQHPPTNYY